MGVSSLLRKCAPSAKPGRGQVSTNKASLGITDWTMSSVLPTLNKLSSKATDRRPQGPPSEICKVQNLPYHHHHHQQYNQQTRAACTRSTFYSGHPLLTTDIGHPVSQSSTFLSSCGLIAFLCDVNTSVLSFKQNRVSFR